jgi:dipeptidyl aminopeptidase/acylaminoacyl peptidase
MSSGHMVVVSRADGSERRTVPLPPQALAQSPSLSPNGSRLALAYAQDADNPSPSDLWTVSVDGEGLKRLFSTGGVFSVAWSPDGERIAFVDGDRGDVYIIGADGSDPHRVARAFTAFDVELSWSPESDRIAFMDEEQRVSVVGADGGTSKVLSPNGRAPAWSPDGKRIAFLRAVPGNQGSDMGIFVMEVEGGSPRRVGPAFGDWPDRLSWTAANVLPEEALKTARPIDLHKVDWANVTLPGSVCGAKHPIRLRNSQAVVASTRWPDWPRVTVASRWNPVVYGDADGDGADEAALVVNCNNGGGTASGVLAYAQVIFTAAKHAPRVLGVVTPQSPRTYGAPLVQVKIHPGEIVAHEFWYGLHDGTCCPSGRSVTTWMYANGTLRLGKTVVEQKPRA